MIENLSPHRRDPGLYARDDGSSRGQVRLANLSSAIYRMVDAGNDNLGQTCDLDSEPKLDADGASYTLLLSTVSVAGLKKQLRAMLAEVERSE